MRFAAYRRNGVEGLAAAECDGPFRGYAATDGKYPGSLAGLVARGSEHLLAAGRALLTGPEIDLSAAALLPPLPTPPKIVCIGLNYADHSAESGFKVPDYPTVFGRFASSLIGHGAPIVRPRVSEQLDYEGEFVAVIGRGGRDIPRERALSITSSPTPCSTTPRSATTSSRRRSGRWARTSTAPAPSGHTS